MFRLPLSCRFTLSVAITCGVLAVLSAASPAAAGESAAATASNIADWYEWAFPLDDPALEEIDLSHFLHRPAGKHGFLTVNEEGHFVFADTGMPLRTGFFALEADGAVPVLAEPVDAQVRLATSAVLRAYPLGPRGERRDPLASARDEAGFRTQTRHAQSPWVLLAAEQLEP